MKEFLDLKTISRWAQKYPEWASLPFFLITGLVIVGIAAETTSNTNSANSTLEQFAPIKPDSAFTEKPSDTINITDEGAFERAYVLQNAEHLVSDDFSIPQSKTKRVGFYFDLFTKYSETDLIIFNANDPSLVYDISSIKDLLEKKVSAKLRTTLINLRAQAKIQQIQSSISMIRSLSDSELKDEEDLKIKRLIERWSPKSKSGLVKASQGISFAVGQKNRFLHLVENRKYELSTIEAVLKAHGLPWEYSRVYLLPNETGWKLNANLDLQIRKTFTSKYLLSNEFIDESLSPIKTARVLAKLLKEDRRRTFKTILRFNGDISSAFLAALHAEQYLAGIYKDKISSEQIPYSIRAVKLKRPAKWTEFIKHARAPESELRRLNPDLNDSVYKSNLMLPKGLVVFIPVKTKPAVASREL